MVVLPTVRLVVTEGNYLLLGRPEWREVRRELTQVWFLQTDDATRIRRLVARHVRFGKDADAADAWVTEVDEANTALLRTHGDPPDRVVASKGDSWSMRLS